MRFEDGREFVEAAEAALLANREFLQLPGLSLQRLAEFLEQAEGTPLTVGEKEDLVDQAILTMDQIYAHLPFKRARYAVEPVQRLRLLRVRAAGLSERAFHSELLEIFFSVRDAHTFYGLPSPYRGAMAFLPFDMEWYVDADHAKRHFLVTSVMDGFSHPHFAPTAEVLAWNGVPIERAVLSVAELEAGGNDAAKFSRGVDAMTLRPLTFSLPPDGQYVVVEYIAAEGSRGGRKARGIVLPWIVAKGFEEKLFRGRGAVSIADSRYQTRAGQKLIWCREELMREYRGNAEDEPDFSSLNLNFYDVAPPEAVEESPASGTEAAGEAPAAPRARLSRDSVLPDTFEFCFSDSEPGDAGIDPSSLQLRGKLRDKRFGYLRIKRFAGGAGDSGDLFFEEFLRIVGLMRERAAHGLILDIRGNPGGSIQDAERLLQLFTPRKIEPQSFHFANTLLMQHLTQQVLQELQALDFERDSPEKVTRVSIASAELSVATLPDIAEQVVSGSPLADGRPLSDADTINALGQRYHAPVVLLVNARAYSAADIFCAGFQDHEIGEVIGEDANTGGGGASRWTHQEDLVEVFGQTPGMPFRALPRNAALAVAIRRCTRQGKRVGQALEDTGVLCDLVHPRTKDDVLHDSRDLLRFACERLAARAAYRLETTGNVLERRRLRVNVEAENLDRIEFLVDGRPQRSVATPRQCRSEYAIPLHGLTPEAVSTLAIHGFARMARTRGERDLQSGDLYASCVLPFSLPSECTGRFRVTQGQPQSGVFPVLSAVAQFRLLGWCKVRNVGDLELHARP
ncbi:MAG: S41 family peptidase [Bryobacterales bacterium]|nr:S41 family peptidase [Bryobacterales bacterium]